MNQLKVIKVNTESIEFDNGILLESDHSQDCCENHYLSFGDLTISDFEGMEFDLAADFFERIEGYGIAILPINGHPVRVPGYGYNNGYYSSNLDLILRSNNGGIIKRFDISECQNITD